MNVSNLPPSREPPDSAESWLARLLSPDCDSSDFAAFEDWVAASPRNAVAYAEAERMHALARASQPQSQPQSQPNPASAAVDLSQVRIAPRRRPAPRSRLPLFAAAAVLVLALASGWGAWLAWGPSPPLQYVTSVGERRNVALPDGSTLVLDTDTSLMVSYRRSLRRIELSRGRIQADVAPDRERPFVVASGVGTVRAVGTVFQVEHRDGGTQVRLLEGRVVVATQTAERALELRPLQQIGYGGDGKLGGAQSIDRGAAEAWTRGRLVFREKPLAELIVEVNRYSRDRLVLAKPELGEIRISGSFAADDRQALISALQRGWGLRAERTGADVTTLYRQD